MKRTLSLFLSLLSVVLLNANSLSLFEQGNKAYRDGDFKQAEEIFNQILDNGAYSFELYYNLGNVYFKLDNLGRSRLNYEKALKLNQGDPDVLKNLNLLKSKLQDDIEPIPPFFLWRAWNSVSNLFSSNVWFLISMILFFSAASMIILRFYEKLELNRGGIILLGVAFLIGTISLIFSYGTFAIATSKSEAVVISKVESLLEGADERAPEIRQIHEGTKVFLLDGLQGWAKVKLEDGDTGWLKEEVLEVF